MLFTSFTKFVTNTSTGPVIFFESIPRATGETLDKMVETSARNVKKSSFIDTITTPSKIGKSLSKRNGYFGHSLYEPLV